jgi:thiamine-phosphate pyrophosphorylase
MPPRVARRVAPRGFLIGRSVHRVEEAVMAAPDVDYLIAGTVWPTESKVANGKHRLLGVEGLAAIAASAGVPVVAIGGVTLDRIEAVCAAGAAGIAAIGLFMGDEPHDECRAIPLSERVAAIRLRFDTSRAAS